jgi:hypothetical protein
MKYRTAPGTGNLPTRFFHFSYQKKSATKINKVSTKSEIFQAKIDN